MTVMLRDLDGDTIRAVLDTCEHAITLKFGARAEIVGPLNSLMFKVGNSSYPLVIFVNPNPELYFYKGKELQEGGLAVILNDKMEPFIVELDDLETWSAVKVTDLMEKSDGQKQTEKLPC